MRWPCWQLCVSFTRGCEMSLPSLDADSPELHHDPISMWTIATFVLQATRASPIPHHGPVDPLSPDFQTHHLISLPCSRNAIVCGGVAIDEWCWQPDASSQHRLPTYPLYIPGGLSARKITCISRDRGLRHRSKTKHISAVLFKVH